MNPLASIVPKSPVFNQPETDFLSTCIFIGGSGELDRWLSDEDIEVIAVDENGIVYCSDSIKGSKAKRKKPSVIRI